MYSVKREFPNTSASLRIQKIITFLLDIATPMFMDYREKLVNSLGQFIVKILPLQTCITDFSFFVTV